MTPRIGLRNAQDALVIVRCEDPSSIPAPVPAPDLEVRPLDLLDPATLAAWLVVHAAAFDTRWTPEDQRRAFDAHPIITVLDTAGVYDRSGALLGAASIATYRRAPSIGLPHYIFVHPDVQETGVGALLLRHRYADLVRHGIDAIECQTHLRRRSSLWLHFSHGFVPKYRFEHFNSPDNAGRLTRALVRRRLRATYEAWRARPPAPARDTR